MGDGTAGKRVSDERSLARPPAIDCGLPDAGAFRHGFNGEVGKTAFAKEDELLREARRSRLSTGDTEVGKTHRYGEIA